MADPLSITSDLEYDEGIGAQSDDSDVSSLSSALQDAIDALVSLNFLPSPPSGFPQYAEVTDFFTSGSPVTDIKLASDANGSAFSQSTGVATDLYYGSYQVSLYATDDENVVVGRVGGASGSIVLVIALNDDLSGDPSLGVAVYAPLVHGDGSAVDDADTLNLAGKVYLYDTFSTLSVVPFNDFSHVPSGQDAFALIASSDPNLSGVDLLTTGFAGSTAGTVNVSTTGLGANSQAVDNGSSLRIDIVSANAADLAKADTSTEVHNTSNISYQNHVDAIAAGFQLTQNNPTNKLASLTVSAYQVSGDSQGSSFVSNAFSNGTLVKIDPSQVVITDASGNDVTSSFAANITQSGDGMSVLITGLPRLYHVDFTADGNFDRFIVTNTMTGATDKTTFDVGGIHVSTITGGTDHEAVDLGAHMIFEDDGPTVALSTDSASVTVDETALGTSDSADFSTLFTVDYGADGEGTIAYSLGVSAAGANSTLVDTASGHGIFLYTDGNDVVGRVGSSLTTADSGGAIAFRISVDTDGNVQLDQSLAIKHGNTGDDNETVVMTINSLVTLTATAYDNEGANSDSGSATANIAASFTFHDDGPSIASPIDAAHDFVVAANSNGATGSNNFDIAGGADGLASYVFTGTPDSSGDYTWTWNSDHTVITESYKGSALFSLTLDPSDGSYDMAMLGSLPPKTDHLDTSDIKAGGPGTHYIDVGLLGSGNAIRIDGSPGFINESHAYVGVNNGNFDTGETMTFSMVNSSGTALDFFGMDIGGKSAQGSSYHWVAYDNGSAVASGDTGIIAKGAKATIDPAGDIVVDQIVITKMSGNANKVGLADIDIFLPPVDTGFVYNVQVTDGDGDHHGSSFTAYIDADGGGIDTSTVFLPGLSA